MNDPPAHILGLTPYGEWVHSLLGRVKDKRDNVIVIDGDEGEGKSALAIRLLHQIHQLWGKEPPNPENVIFDWSDWDRLYSYKKQEQVYFIDEGGDLVLNLDWNSESIRRFRKLMMKARALRSTLIIAIPEFWYLDKYLREHRVKWRLHVEHRGWAVPQYRSKNWRKGETWFQDTDWKIGEYNGGEANTRGVPGWGAYEDEYPEFAKVYEDRKMQSIEKSDWTQPARGEDVEVTGEQYDYLRKEYKQKRAMSRMRKWGVSVPPSKPSSPRYG